MSEKKSRKIINCVQQEKCTDYVYIYIYKTPHPLASVCRYQPVKQSIMGPGVVRTVTPTTEEGDMGKSFPGCKR